MVRFFGHSRRTIYRAKKKPKPSNPPQPSKLQRALRPKGKSQKNAKRPETYPVEARKIYPTVAKQGLELVWIESGRLLDGPYHYNSSIIECDSRIWMAYRDQDERRKSRIGIAELNAELAPERTFELTLPRHFEKIENKEDPRLFQHGGSTWISYSAWDGYAICAIALCELTSSWQVRREIQIAYGNNWKQLCFQKNWCFFQRPGDGGIYCVYSPNPHEVIQIGESVAHRISLERGVEWKWGLARGGTPPVLKDGFYWSFFHSRLQTPSGRPRYFMGAYAFDAAPPFRVRRVSREPLLAGSDQDPMGLTLPLVVFPCGAVLRQNEWLVSLGVNDCRTAIVKIPHERLEKGCVTCS